MRIKTIVSMFGNPSSEFFLSDQDIENMLTESPDAEPIHWPFRLNTLDEFCNKVEKLFVVSNGGFTFQVTWMGEPTRETVSLSLADFLATIRRNELGPKTKYVVIGTI